jgi:hypothetical protein
VIPRSIYANPENPSICCILALGLKVLTDSVTDNNDGPLKLFSGDCSSAKFSVWLENTLSKLDAVQLVSLGSLPRDIGSHSGRKGGATYVCGITAGPDSDSVKLRMGHTLGNVSDRYIFTESGSDRYVGRSVAGLNHDNISFGILPPHFSDETISQVPWSEIIPNYHRFGAGMKSATPFLVASVVFHQTWIRRNLSSNHHIFSSRFWCSRHLSDLTSQVKVGIGKNTDTGLIATGLPRHIVQAYEISQLQNQICNLNASVHDLPVFINDMIINNLSSVNGIQVSNDITISRHIAPLREHLAAIQASIEARELPIIPSQEGNTVQYRWGNDMHPVPEGFRFPKCTTMNLWALWIYGNEDLGIGPYCLIKARSLPLAEKSLLSKAKYVMSMLIAHSGYNLAQLKDKPLSTTDKILGDSFRFLLNDLKVSTNIDAIHFSIVYSHLKSLQK